MQKSTQKQNKTNNNKKATQLEREKTKYNSTVADNYNDTGTGEGLWLSKRNLSEDASWLENAENVPIFPPAGLIWLFYQYSYNRSTFSFEFS